MGGGHLEIVQMGMEGPQNGFKERKYSFFVGVTKDLTNSQFGNTFYYGREDMTVGRR